MAESTEAQVIKQFIPTLVVAVDDCVQSVSDKCLIKGLISETTSKRVLDPRGGTSEERARTLIHSVHTSTKTDRSCFQIFLEVLDEELPYRVREKVLSDMKKELADRAAVMCKAVVHVSQESRPVPLSDLGLECIQQQSASLGRYEDAVSKHASASTQKSLIEETLQSRSEESGRLKASLDMMMSQSHDHERDEKQITSTRNRISVCESEIANLRKRIEELERIIEEENMRARRGRNTITVETKRLLEEFTKQSQEQFLTVLRNKEQEHKRILAEKEVEIRRQVQDEMNFEIKDLKHEVALLNKEVKIKDLQLSMEQKGRKSRSELKVSGSPVLEGVGLLHRPLYKHNHNELSSLYAKRSVDELELDDTNKVVSPHIFMGSRHLKGFPMTRQRSSSHASFFRQYDQKKHILQSHQLETRAKRRKTSRSIDPSTQVRSQTFGDLIKTGLIPPPTKRIRLESDESANLIPHLIATTRELVDVDVDGPQSPLQHTSDPVPVATISSHHLPSLLQQLYGHAASWRDIGGALGFTQGELDTIQASPSLHAGAPRSWLTKMLSDWLQWAPGDGRGSTYFATLEKLKDALKQANLGATAYTLHV